MAGYGCRVSESFFDSLLACFENCAEPFLLSGQNSSQRQRA